MYLFHPTLLMYKEFGENNNLGGTYITHPLTRGWKVVPSHKRLGATIVLLYSFHSCLRI